MWPVVIRMKTVSRVLLFLGGAVLWAIAFTLLNDRFGNVDENVLLMGAAAVALVQTWALALTLHT